MNIDLYSFLEDRALSINDAQFQDFLILEKELLDLESKEQLREELYGQIN
jgi:hypothetical protein